MSAFCCIATLRMRLYCSTVRLASMYSDKASSAVRAFGFHPVSTPCFPCSLSFRTDFIFATLSGFEAVVEHAPTTAAALLFPLFRYAIEAANPNSSPVKFSRRLAVRRLFEGSERSENCFSGRPNCGGKKIVTFFSFLSNMTRRERTRNEKYIAVT